MPADSAINLNAKLPTIRRSKFCYWISCSTGKRPNYCFASPMTKTINTMRKGVFPTAHFLLCDAYKQVLTPKPVFRIVVKRIYAFQ